MFHPIKEVENFMAGLLAASVIAAIATIHNDNEVEQEVTDQVNTAVTAAAQPYEDQITDLQSAVTKIVAQLANNDTSGAQATATAAQAAAASASAGAPGSAVNPPVAGTAADGTAASTGTSAGTTSAS